ncbi:MULTISPECIES: ABC transporter substrate-binding protein [Acidiphilium]|uniref:NitT/TauT family transport system substrate-binding protein n=1 Tax=Acidiphilium rubrum TaxID=526 RepID=A0A8G2CNK9_ACIRU|nr:MULTISPECIES: ABC transporter substrate-binding protein [Acidiphilium]SIR46334.1 NitT/TauT family transport system substrate-binding protein [Acidiphilium rubrum]
MKRALAQTLGALCLAGTLLSPAQAASPQKVVIYQAFQSLLYLPLYVAIDQGIFAKHGLAIDKVTAGSGAAAVAAVIGGNATFSLQDPMTAILANLKGASMTNVALVVNGAPVWVVVPKGSNITSIAGLAGKPIATAIPPSTSTYLLQRLLKRDKSTATLDTVQIGTELAPTMAGRAAAAAAAVYEPQLDEGLAAGDKIIYAFTKHYPGGYAFSTIDMLKATGVKDPAMVKAFVASLAEAEHLMHTNPKTPLEVAEKEFPTLPAPVLKSAVARMVSEDVYPANPTISPKAFENALALQIFIGNIKPGQVTFKDAVEPAFAK